MNTTLIRIVCVLCSLPSSLFYDIYGSSLSYIFIVGSNMVINSVMPEDLYQCLNIPNTAGLHFVPTEI